jgi:hypothetical protein
MDNYKAIATKLANREPFTGNSLKAYWVSVDGGHEYQVISYNTVIARSKHLDNAWVSPERYSNTTSRAQNLIKRAWGLTTA